MIQIIKKEIEMEESLKQRLEFICQFCKTKPTFINGSIRKIDKSNLNFIEPHRVIIKGITFLVFNYSTDIYIKNLTNKIQVYESYRYTIIIKNYCIMLIIDINILIINSYYTITILNYFVLIKWYFFFFKSIYKSPIKTLIMIFMLLCP